MKPIIFSTEMVTAILAGTKRQTRRVIKSQNCIPNDAKWGYTAFTPKGHISYRGMFGTDYGEKSLKLKYHPKDTLYVRERCLNLEPEGHYKTDYVYMADNIELPKEVKWRPSIHMPREAARIFLKVESVKVERLQDMSEGDGFAEGFPKLIDPGAHTGGNGSVFDWFRILWDSINSKRPEYQWDKSPWVWVISFSRIDKSEVL